MPCSTTTPPHPLSSLSYTTLFRSIISTAKPHVSAAQSGNLHMLAPLMPKATAVWLVENTSLTFEQIAEFCGLHPLEVQAIADGDRKSTRLKSSHRCISYAVF